eukprot:TRINITY_DN33735_c0_g1_i1.p2 TRINITY_DN33735_c0_g1~~TRINITY_DN33735_c0_g1_i1.p2  ORF type:complete len:208 (+),score=71.17 TRINITY_DN33735_c0_g1_i1:63-626(+)
MAMRGAKGSASFVCSTAVLKGPHEIRLGLHNIVHPLVRISARNGPIEIGDGNIIEEHTEIVNDLPVAEGGDPPVLRIGSMNLFGPRSYVAAESVGDACAFQACSSAQTGSKIGSDCVVCARRKVDAGERIADGTVIWGPNGERRVCTEEQIRAAGHREEVGDLVRQLLTELPPHNGRLTAGFVQKQE